MSHNGRYEEDAVVTDSEDSSSWNIEEDEDQIGSVGEILSTQDDQTYGSIFVEASGDLATICNNMQCITSCSCNNENGWYANPEDAGGADAVMAKSRRAYAMTAPGTGSDAETAVLNATAKAQTCYHAPVDNDDCQFFTYIPVGNDLYDYDTDVEHDPGGVEGKPYEPSDPNYAIYRDTVTWYSTTYTFVIDGTVTQTDTGGLGTAANCGGRVSYPMSLNGYNGAQIYHCGILRGKGTSYNATKFELKTKSDDITVWSQTRASGGPIYKIPRYNLRDETNPGHCIVFVEPGNCKESEGRYSDQATCEKQTGSTCEADINGCYVGKKTSTCPEGTYPDNTCGGAVDPYLKGVLECTHIPNTRCYELTCNGRYTTNPEEEECRFTCGGVAGGCGETVPFKDGICYACENSDGSPDCNNIELTCEGVYRDYGGTGQWCATVTASPIDLSATDAGPLRNNVVLSSVTATDGWGSWLSWEEEFTYPYNALSMTLGGEKCTSIPAGGSGTAACKATAICKKGDAPTCPEGYYEDKPSSNYFNYEVSNGCYKVTGCATGYAQRGGGDQYEWHGFYCARNVNLPNIMEVGLGRKNATGYESGQYITGIISFGRSDNTVVVNTTNEYNLADITLNVETDNGSVLQNVVLWEQSDGSYKSTGPSYGGNFNMKACTVKTPSKVSVTFKWKRTKADGSREDMLKTVDLTLNCVIGRGSSIVRPSN